MNTPRTHRRAPSRATRTLALTASALVLVAAITTLLVRSSDDDTEPAAKGTPSAAVSRGAGSTDPSTRSVATGEGGPGGSGTLDPEHDAITTPTELERFVLRGSDLPPGWRTLDAASAATQELMGGCLRDATTPTVPHVLNTVSFRSGSNGPVLSSSVRDFTTAAQAERGMTEVGTDISGCLQGPGRPELTSFALTSTADAAVGVTFTVTRDGTSARGEVIVARVGARTVTLALIGLTAKDLDLGKQAIRTVIVRLR